MQILTLGEDPCKIYPWEKIYAKFNPGRKSMQILTLGKDLCKI